MAELCIELKIHLRSTLLPLKIPLNSRINFQNANSPIIENLIFFHNHAITIIILIVTIVGYNIISTVNNENVNLNLMESQDLELFWTVVPALILLFIGFPSIRLLYIIDEVRNPLITFKTVGHQWYWRYEYSDFSDKEFDSYMIPSEEIQDMSSVRLLEVDNRVVLPFKAQVRNLISSFDVLHSWTVPALGVKADAVPGRLNQVRFIISRPGLFYGQCSEICGANHRFMPITIESVNSKDFINWVKII